MKSYPIINKQTGEIRNLKFENLAAAVEYVTQRNRDGLHLGFVNKEKNKSMNNKPLYQIAFTGHRPNKIGGYDQNNPKRQAVIKALESYIQRAVDKYGNTHQIVAITGGALGVDQDAARVAYKMGIPFIVAVPCQNHDSKWPAEAKARYKKMLSLAHEVVMVHDGPYNNTCMQKRNEWMVDHCDALIAVWDGSSGGTANCVNYAKKVNKPIVIINPNNLGGNGGQQTPPTPDDNNNGGDNSPPIPKEETMKTIPPTAALIKQELPVAESSQKGETTMEERPIQEWVLTGSRTGLAYDVWTKKFKNTPSTEWRVITNDIKYWFGDRIAKGELKAEPVLRGNYNAVFLKQIFGNKRFLVEISAMQSGYGYFRPYYDNNTKNLVDKPDSYVFGWANLDSETVIMCEDENFTMESAGVVIGNGAKAPKRFTEIVRFARGASVQPGIQIKKVVLPMSKLSRVFPYLTKDQLKTGFDGISIVSPWLVKKSYKDNPNMSRKDLGRMLREVDNGIQTNWTIRCVTNIDGSPCMIKGNAIPMNDRLATHKRLWGLGLIPNGEFFDLITFDDNVKSELGTDGSFETITFEPHHGPSYVRTNDLMLSLFYGIKGLMDPQELIVAWTKFLNEAVENLREGKDISWMVEINSSSGGTEVSKIKEALNGPGTISVLNQQIAALHEVGLPIGVSQSLMNMRANAVVNSSIGKDHVNEGKKFDMSGSFEDVNIFNIFKNWMTSSKEKKSNLVVPHAYRAYVMTLEVLYLAGYDIDLDSEHGFYHEETQTFAVSSEVWSALAPVLGGADLDDEIMIFERLVKDLDGSFGIKAFVLRSPNDWAEYGIVDIDGPSGQARIAYDDMPILDMKDLEQFKTTPECGNLPSVDGISSAGNARPMPKVYNDDCVEYMWRTSAAITLGVGGQVKNKMIHYATYGAFNSLPCPNEQMIDALQAPTGTIDDMRVLDNWEQNSFISIVTGDVSMDAYWWHSRSIGKTVDALISADIISANDVAHPMPANESPIVRDLMIPRQMAVMAAWQEMVKIVNGQIVEIEEIQDVFQSRQDQETFITRVNDKAKDFKNGNSKDVATNILNNALQTYNKAISSGNNNDLKNFYMYLLKMARASYLLKKRYIEKNYHSTANFDQWLYYSVSQDGKTMVDLFTEALSWYKTQR